MGESRVCVCLCARAHPVILRRYLIKVETNECNDNVLVQHEEKPKKMAANPGV